MSSHATTADTVADLWADYVTAGRPAGGPHEDALARHYLPYATQVGDRFHRRVGDAVERDDILQNGYLGLIDAIRTYDPTKSAFNTYASRKIEWKIADGLRDGDWLPRRRRDNVKLVQQALADLQHAGTLYPTDEELAHATDLPVTAVRTAYEDFVASRVHSLNDLTGTEDGPGEEPGTRLHDRTQTPAEDQALRTALTAEMFQAIRILPDRDKQMIALFYYGEHTLDEIAQVFDITFSRVSQLLKRAVFVLRTSMDGAAADR